MTKATHQSEAAPQVQHSTIRRRCHHQLKVSMLLIQRFMPLLFFSLYFLGHIDVSKVEAWQQFMSRQMNGMQGIRCLDETGPSFYVRQSHVQARPCLYKAYSRSKLRQQLYPHQFLLLQRQKQLLLANFQLNAQRSGSESADGKIGSQPTSLPSSKTRSSSLSATPPPEPREVDLGIFGSRQTSPQDIKRSDPMQMAVNGDKRGSLKKTTKVKGADNLEQRRRTLQERTNSDKIPNKNEKTDSDNADDDLFGFARTLFRRIRGKEESLTSPQPPALTTPATSPTAQQGLARRSSAGQQQTQKQSPTKQQQKGKVPSTSDSTKKVTVSVAPSTKQPSESEKSKQSTTDLKKESSSSWTNRFTSWISGNGSSSGDDENESPDVDKDKSSGSPLSGIVQKFWGKSSQPDQGEEWVTVFPKTRISPGELVPVTAGGIDLLVVASNDGKNRLYCVANSCPHLGTPLELGQLVRLPAEGDSSSPTSASNSDSSSNPASTSLSWTERQVSSILQQDGCEDCIVCPLHKTAFALESGQVRGEWCPYPPVVGTIVGAIKPASPMVTFGVRVRGKDVQVRINSPIHETENKASGDVSNDSDKKTRERT